VARSSASSPSERSRQLAPERDSESFHLQSAWASWCRRNCWKVAGSCSGRRWLGVARHFPEFRLLEARDMLSRMLSERPLQAHVRFLRGVWVACSVANGRVAWQWNGNRTGASKPA
jgi:hypothetical protein